MGPSSGGTIAPARLTRPRKKKKGRKRKGEAGVYARTPALARAGVGAKKGKKGEKREGEGKKGQLADRCATSQDPWPTKKEEKKKRDGRETICCNSLSLPLSSRESAEGE